MSKLLKSGIYKITCLYNNTCYIGSAVHIRKRFETHRSTLRNNKHFNAHLQRAWNKYGESLFQFEILLTCPPEYLVKLEQWAITTLRPGFNKRTIANSNQGVRFSTETRKLLSLKATGRKHTIDTIQKISQAKQGQPNPFKGKHHTAESKLKMSIANKGNTYNLGKIPSLEKKQKISASLKKYYENKK